MTLELLLLRRSANWKYIMSKKKITPETPVDSLAENVELNEAKEALALRIKALEENLKDQEDKYLRLYADFENNRKRSIKEKAEYLSLASKDIIVALLPVLDDVERANANNAHVEDPQALKEGFSLIFNKLSQIMEAKGLKAMETLHEAFNYELHEAIANVPVEDESMKGKIVDQVEKGYYLNDKVIRYAKVVVGQ